MSLLYTFHNTHPINALPASKHHAEFTYGEQRQYCYLVYLLSARRP